MLWAAELRVDPTSTAPVKHWVRTAPASSMRTTRCRSRRSGATAAPRPQTSSSSVPPSAATPPARSTRATATSRTSRPLQRARHVRDPTALLRDIVTAPSGGLECHEGTPETVKSICLTRDTPRRLSRPIRAIWFRRRRRSQTGGAPRLRGCPFASLVDAVAVFSIAPEKRTAARPRPWPPQSSPVHVKTSEGDIFDQIGHLAWRRQELKAVLEWLMHLDQLVVSARAHREHDLTGPPR